MDTLSECHQQHLYFHTCGHILTLTTHSTSCTHRDLSTACPNIYAVPITTQSSTFNPEACHLCTRNTTWLEKSSKNLIRKPDLELAQELNLKEEKRGGKRGASWDEPAIYPSVLALDEGCVVRRVNSGECGCVMEIISHSIACYARGIENCYHNEVLVAEEEIWQENGCAWCRGDNEYIKRFGAVIRRLPGDGRVTQSKPVRDSKMIENWIQKVDTEPHGSAFPFMAQEGYIKNILAATGFCCYEGGEFSYSEYSYCLLEAYWPSDEYVRPAQECFFSHEVPFSNTEVILVPKTPITLFPDEEESLLESYSPALPSLTYAFSSPSLVEDDSINEEFDEIMSIHFYTLLMRQSSEGEDDEEEEEENAISIYTTSESRHVDFWEGGSYGSIQNKTIGSPNTVATELFSVSEGSCGMLG